MVQFKNRLAFIILLLCSCKHAPQPDTGYPKEAGNIILNKCATTGCHNNISYTGAGGLNLTEWDKLFLGGTSGAVVIPYRPDFSTLCYFTNTDSALGVILNPTMPLYAPPLTKEEYLVLKNWIMTGAPDINGRVKFADNANRRKIYVANWLCDVVSVIDLDSKLLMRYIDVGNKSSQEFPECIKVSPDKKNWYVSFFAPSTFIQKFDAANDMLVSEIPLGQGVWTSYTITSDSRCAYIVDNSAIGKIVFTDLNKKKTELIYTFNDSLIYPRGIVLDEQLHKLYVGSSTGNYIYSIDLSDNLKPLMKQIVIDKSGQPQNNSTLDPSNLLIAGGLCYIACKGTNRICVVNMKNDSLLTTIELPAIPQQMDYSPQYRKLFVVCPDDSSTFPGYRGAVIAIDINNNQITGNIKSGYQPYALSVDDKTGILTVANANLNSNGPTPHHVSGCGGRNGNVSFIDLKTMQVIKNKTFEVAVFPKSVATR